MMRQRPYSTGSYVKVFSTIPYPLPDGLPDGATVRVISFETGQRWVEYRGRRFKVPMACVDPGWFTVAG